MRSIARLDSPATLAAIPLVFITGIVYNGPSENLHWFSAFGVLFALWLGAVLVQQLKTVPIKVANGWLPAVALIFSAWLLLTPYLSAFPHSTWLHAIALAVMPLTLLGWLLSPHADRDAVWNYVWRGLVLSALPLGAMGLADFLLLQQRAHGPLIDPNAYGALMNMFLLPLCYQYLSLNAPGSVRLSVVWRLTPFAILVFALAQFASLSRGALLALALTLPAAALLSRRRNRLWAKRLSLLLLILATSYAAVRWLSTEIGIASTGPETTVLALDEKIQTDSSLRERTNLWQSTLRMFLDGNILVGSGLGTFKVFYPAYRSVNDRSAGNHSHNDYLQALQEGGVIHFIFILTMTVFAPLWLTRAAAHDRTGGSSDVPGIMLAVLCISLHALVNFIFSILPIVLLTGLYLARAWETVHSRQEPALLNQMLRGIKFSLVIAVVLVALVAPVSFLILDGIIFKAFVSDRATLHRTNPAGTISAANKFIALRPTNPIPRDVVIVNLIDLAQREEAHPLRARLLDRASLETEGLARIAPGLPSWLFYKGRIHALRGASQDLTLASDLLDQALRRFPQSSTIRLELTQILLRIGQPRRAYEVIQEATPWIPIERNLVALGTLAREGYTLASMYGDVDSSRYWQKVLKAIDQTPH